MQADVGRSWHARITQLLHGGPCPKPCGAIRQEVKRCRGWVEEERGVGRVAHKQHGCRLARWHQQGHVFQVQAVAAPGELKGPEVVQRGVDVLGQRLPVQGGGQARQGQALEGHLLPRRQAQLQQGGLPAKVQQGGPVPRADDGDGGGDGDHGGAAGAGVLSRIPRQQHSRQVRACEADVGGQHHVGRRRVLEVAQQLRRAARARHLAR
mmetsp:Transcript_26098/g.66430  ORF Transcript_26098/g.66430 Transcript_26098/m.66430 type:complete len:209 (+) Transcript_26098:150-776(+)